MIAGGVLVLLVAVVGGRFGRVEGSHHWLFGWVGLVMAGMDPIFVPITSPFNLLSPIYDHIFGVCLLSGTLMFSGHTRWLRHFWWFAVITCLLRLSIQPFLPGIAGPISATIVIGLCSIVSAVVLYRHGQANELAATTWLTPLFLTPSFAQAFFLFLAAANESRAPALFAYVLSGAVLAMAQLMVLMEKARRESDAEKETLALLAQTAPVGLCLTAVDGGLRAINPVAQELLSISAQSDLNLSNWLREQHATIPPVNVTVDVENLAGRAVSMRKEAILTSGTHVGDVWFFEDRTVFREWQNLRGLHNVASNVAHIFNNQLMTISGNTEIIERVGRGEIQAYVDALKEATDRCAQVTQDFLEFSRVEPVNTEPRDVRGLLEDVIQNSEPVVKLDIHTPTLIDVDATAFKRAFQELLTNAAEAGAKQIVITAEQSREHLIVRLQDDGPGVSERVMARAFEPFFTTKQEALGAGLGLSVVEGILLSHGGLIELNSVTTGLEVKTAWRLA